MKALFDWLVNCTIEELVIGIICMVSLAAFIKSMLK